MRQTRSKKTIQNSTSAIARQRELLRLEYEEERRSFTEVAGRLGLTRLVSRGRAWWPLRIGNSFYNSLNQRVVEVYRVSDPDIEHSFEYGRPVAFFTPSDNPEAPVRTLFTGTVSFTDGDRMVVAIPEGADLRRLAESQAGVMLSFDETSFRAMQEALDAVARADGRLARLRDLIYSRTPAAERVFEPLGFPYLNPSQQQGVNKVLAAKEVAVVHGPPGTGKTTTLVEAVHATLQRESQTLVCAQSNMAVDWISEKLLDRGISVLRIGNPSRVTDKMLSFTYERRFEDHPDYPSLWKIRRDIRAMRSVRRRSPQLQHHIEELRRRADELEIRINRDLLAEARVIACTLVGSNHRLLSGLRFSTLFIDETAQALQAACWIPIRKADRVILAGDHCQLPPTVKSLQAARGGLSRSLMEVIVENHPEAVTLLDTQYRMNEEIMRFSSDWFYSGKMKAHPSVSHRGILDLDTPVEWIDTAPRSAPNPAASSLAEAPNRLPLSYCAEAEADSPQEPESPAPLFRESETADGQGRVNPDEALLTVDTLRRFIERIGPSRVLDERIDFAVISPYRAQTRTLRSLVASTPFFRPFRSLITVNTVDGFQGQERDVVVISLVRSNDSSQIGFLRDLRRMNVAMTRARMKLIIIGDSTTMASHPFYRRLLAYIRSLSPAPSPFSASPLSYCDETEADIPIEAKAEADITVSEAPESTPAPR